MNGFLAGERQPETLTGMLVRWSGRRRGLRRHRADCIMPGFSIPLHDLWTIREASLLQPRRSQAQPLKPMLTGVSANAGFGATGHSNPALGKMILPGRLAFTKTIRRRSSLRKSSGI